MAKIRCTPSEKVYTPLHCLFGNTPIANSSQYKTFAKQNNLNKPVSTLPFTGFDLGLILFAGVILVALGVSLRRITRRRTT